MIRKNQIPWVIAAGLLVLAVILLPAGCAVTPAPQQTATSSARVSQSSTGELATPTMTPEIIILTTRLAARAVGKLNEIDGCLRIDGLTIAWPPEFVVTRDGEILRVVGLWGKGETWEFRMGQTITIGGGHPGGLTEGEREQLRVPAGCPGPYWVFGGGTEENLIQPAK